jgi:hypothetical protein
MPKKKPYARIAITLPQADLAAADKLAAAQDRSRSWIIAEAVRRYAAEVAQAGAPGRLDESRRAQLARDAALSPSERVHLAEAIADQAKGAEGPIVYADYEEFRKARRAGRTRP